MEYAVLTRPSLVVFYNFRVLVLKILKKTTESYILAVVPVLAILCSMLMSNNKSMWLIAVDPATYAFPFYEMLKK